MPLLSTSGSHAIVLAAGAGRRFGGGKLMAPLAGQPLIRLAAEAALAAATDTVTVVLGCEAEQIAQVLSPIADPRLKTLVCANWEDGMAASLSCGIESLPGDARAALIFLGDMPQVPTELATRLLCAVMDGAPAAMPTCDGRPAHPVAVNASLFPALSKLTGDKGARDLLMQVAGTVHILTDNPGSIQDVDTADDLNNLQAVGHKPPIWS
jgi:molybdenum cofactor cytidylyltransferase